MFPLLYIAQKKHKSSAQRKSTSLNSQCFRTDRALSRYRRHSGCGYRSKQLMFKIALAWFWKGSIAGESTDAKVSIDTIVQ
jgi:hypothetical protein